MEAPKAQGFSAQVAALFGVVGMALAAAAAHLLQKVCAFGVNFVSILRAHIGPTCYVTSGPPPAPYFHKEAGYVARESVHLVPWTKTSKLHHGLRSSDLPRPYDGTPSHTGDVIIQHSAKNGFFT